MTIRRQMSHRQLITRLRRQGHRTAAHTTYLLTLDHKTRLQISYEELMALVGEPVT